MIIIAAAGAAGARRRRRRRLCHVLERPKEAKPARRAWRSRAVFVDLPEVLVNLSNAGSDRTQYLKVKIVLELPDAEAGRADHSR